MKKVLCIALSVLMVLSLSINICAANSTNDSIEDFALNTMVKYVNASYTGNDVVTISEAIDIYNCGTNSVLSYTYFAISDNDIIGMLVATEQNGKYVSSYIPQPYSELLNVYKNGEEFALISYHDEIILKTHDGMSILTSNYNNVDLNSSDLSALNVKMGKIIDSETVITIYPKSRSTLMIKLYDVPIVSNDTYNGSGLCWAASVASMSNYYHNTSYTARDIYNLCEANYSGTPAGNNTWYNRAYSLLNMSVSINTSSPALTYNQIYGNLVTYGPIQIGLKRVDSDGVSHAHAIIISGIQVFQDTANNPSNYYAIYYIIDSNLDTEINYIVDYDAMCDGELFEYIPCYAETRCYDTWVRTITVTSY